MAQLAGDDNPDTHKATLCQEFHCAKDNFCNTYRESSYAAFYNSSGTILVKADYHQLHHIVSAPEKSPF